MEEITFRSIRKSDLDDVFLLLQQLAEIDYSSRNKNVCWDLFKNNNS